MARYKEKGMRYIDADALIEDIQETICAKCGDIFDGIKCKSCGIDDTLDFLENAPTADVVPRQELDDALLVCELTRDRVRELEVEVEEISGKYEDLKLRYLDLAKDHDELLTWGGHIKSTERAEIEKAVEREIFEEIDNLFDKYPTLRNIGGTAIAELKKKYIKGD